MAFLETASILITVPQERVYPTRSPFLFPMPTDGQATSPRWRKVCDEQPNPYFQRTCPAHNEQRRHPPLDPPQTFHWQAPHTAKVACLFLDADLCRLALLALERQTLVLARSHRSAFYDLRLYLLPHRYLDPLAVFARHRPRHLFIYSTIWPRLVRMGLPSNGLHGIPLSTDRTLARRPSCTTPQTR